VTTWRRAAKQTIYERLIPKRWPVLYDLGGIPNARDWYCEGPFVDKNLFNDEPDSAQTQQRFERTNWNPRIALAEVHASGTVRAARILGPPASLMDPLFRDPKDPAGGGIGLTKLEFFSPRLFRYFPREPSGDRAILGITDEYQTLAPSPGYISGGIPCSQVPDPPGNSG